MAVLSPAALSMLITLYVQVGAGDPDEPVWIAPDYAQQTFQLSEETRNRGLYELELAQLVTVHRRALTVFDSFEVRRFRNVYAINYDRFNEPAVIPLPIRGETRTKPPEERRSFF